ncbi:CCA tRNA nucleotidyltransferase [Clostridium sp. LP20]|uniref:CCA tRNA nucleotidyltransferase n=1 Tax=Clostridium sp. LP20 TaxID=3418665 RepID=UPI003EE72F64
MNIKIPSDVQFIIDCFYNNGYEAFMVGGCVRDSLLNKDPMDYDITTSAPPEVTEKLFSKTIPTGIQHGTITVLINNVPYEVTTYRTEGKYIDNRRPDRVDFVTSIKEDLSRRDFTINAFAYNNKEGLIDYFSGMSDLNKKNIRSVGIANDRFNEDALRMLRAIRFSSQLDFSIEAKTYNAISINSSLIKNISHERIRVEISKILLSNNPFKGLCMLKDTGILSRILPELTTKINPNIDLVPNNISCKLVALFKNLDIEIISKVLKRLTFDNSTINRTLILTKHYKDIDNCNSKSDCKRLISKVGPENIFDLISLHETIEMINLSTLRNYVNSILDNQDPIYIKDLNIDGNTLKTELNLISGKIIGDLLNHLLNLVIDDKINNDTSSLLIAAKKYNAIKGSSV